MSYFLIRDLENGRNVEPIEDLDELSEFLKEYTDGGVPIVFVNQLPESSWRVEHMPRNTFCLIKGEIVMPKPVEKVIEWEVE